MDSSVLEKIRRLKASRPQSGGVNRVKGIFHQFQDGENIIRLVGEFLEVRTHFIAPATARKDRGLCIPAAFQGDGKLPQIINCPDWDIDKEVAKKDKTCPICKLRAIARKVLKEHVADLSSDEKTFYDNLARMCSPVTKLKWNIIDRKDPYVIADDNGRELKVLGLKIATIGMEAWNDINGIFDQVQADITDPDEGIDISVVKGNNGTRVSYSAKAVIEGKSLKVTPLTPEERALSLHDLKAINSKAVDVNKIVDALHEDLRQALEAVTVESSDTDVPETEEVVEDTEEVVSAPVKAAPKARPVTAMPQRPVNKAPVIAQPAHPTLSKEVVDAIDEALADEDGDGLMDGTSAQKKT